MCLLINLMVKWSVLNEVFFSLSTVFVEVLRFLTDIFNELTHTHTLTHTPTHTHTHKWTCQTRLKHRDFWLFVTGLFLDIKLQQLRCGLYWCHCFFYVTVITEISLPCWLVFKGVVQLNLLFSPSVHEKETKGLNTAINKYIWTNWNSRDLVFSSQISVLWISWQHFRYYMTWHLKWISCVPSFVSQQTFGGEAFVQLHRWTTGRRTWRSPLTTVSSSESSMSRGSTASSATPVSSWTERSSRPIRTSSWAPHATSRLFTAR